MVSSSSALEEFSGWKIDPRRSADLISSGSSTQLGLFPPIQIELRRSCLLLLIAVTKNIHYKDAGIFGKLFLKIYFRFSNDDP